MSTAIITNRVLGNLRPNQAAYFVRDIALKGFGVKVNPSGKIVFVSEVWHEGRSHRKTIGSYPVLKLQQARTEALAFITSVKTGELEAKKARVLVLKSLFDAYVSTGRLKPRTVVDYREAVYFYLSDWMSKPVAAITKQMVEARFYKIRDQGVNGGKPTYSQATKTMRILSALMNCALADEIIEQNPVDVLKLKRIDRSMRKRDNYLPAMKVRELLEGTVQDRHPATLAVHLMLYTGLRRNEALRLMWSDIEEIEGIRCIIVRDTKNHRPHYVPITENIQGILDLATNGTENIFASTRKKDCPTRYVRTTLNRLSKMIQFEFRCHDLRRTFATRASEAGIDFLTVKRLLNHKSHDITSQYIQWNSRENLLVMREALQRVVY